MFQRVYGSLRTSVFDRVGVLRELLCVRYGYCSQALLSSDEMFFIVRCSVCSNVHTFLLFIVYFCTIFILNKSINQVDC